MFKTFIIEPNQMRRYQYIIVGGIAILVLIHMLTVINEDSGRNLIFYLDLEPEHIRNFKYIVYI